MTAVRPAPPSAAALPPGPAPRRVRPPRWLDLRLLLGVLLVLGSVLLGARVVGAADATVPVWAASGDLAAGTELDADDLVAVDVRLDDTADAYLSTSTRPEGRTLARAVRAGELVPGSALEEPTTWCRWPCRCRRGSCRRGSGAAAWSTCTRWRTRPWAPRRQPGAP